MIFVPLKYCKHATLAGKYLIYMCVYIYIYYIYLPASVAYIYIHTYNGLIIELTLCSCNYKIECSCSAVFVIVVGNVFCIKASILLRNFRCFWIILSGSQSLLGF